MPRFEDIITTIDCVVTEDSQLQDVARLMYLNKWNAVPVMDHNRKLKGIFTRSSFFQMIMNKEPLNSPIRKYIKKQVVTLNIDTPYEKIETIVKKSKVGTGVVLNEQEQVVGILTKTDMVMSLLNSTNLLKKQLETILQYSNLGIMLTDEKGKIIFVNARLCEMSSRSEEAFLQQPLELIFPDIENTTSFKPVKVEQNKAVISISTYQADKNGKGKILFFHDISEIEKMAQELETTKNLKITLETVLNHAYDGILMSDEKRNIIMANPPLLELFDLQLNQVLHQPAAKVLPHFHLENVYKTAEAEISDFQEINGIQYIVHRIPILQDGKVIGAIGKVMFRQLNEVSELFKKLQKAENKANFYKRQYVQAESAKFTWEHLLTADPYMEKLKKSGAKAAKGRSTILIRGESGTGKELFAHAIHNSSARSSEKFVVVNCAAIPEDLLESEFFGYEEGAFTGAKQKGKIGKFDLANGGTLFLDEIGDMSVSLQAKLLRVLQEREFYRVGGTSRIQVDVRIVAATNRNLEEMVKEGSFREDLYYRLNVISFYIPPLRERKHDIEYLMMKLMAELNQVLGTTIIGAESRAKGALLDYSWPGNIRELRNVLERAMTFAEYGKIKFEDLPDYLISQVPGKPPNVSLVENAELEAIKRALAQVKGNKVKAARLLGISRSGLYEKIKKYNLPY